MPPDPNDAFDGGWPTSQAAIHRWASGNVREIRQALQRYEEMERRSRAAALEALGVQRQADLARVRAEDVYPPACPGSWSAADYRLVRALSVLALVTVLAPNATALQRLLASVRGLAAGHELAGLAVQSAVAQGSGPVPGTPGPPGLVLIGSRGKPGEADGRIRPGAARRSRPRLRRRRQVAGRQSAVYRGA